MKNVLELKTKKMSLANIEGRLTPTEMENIMAGSMSRACMEAMVGVGLGVAGFMTSLAGGPFTIGLGFAGFMWSVATTQGACHGQI